MKPGGGGKLEGSQSQINLPNCVQHVAAVTCAGGMFAWVQLQKFCLSGEPSGELKSAIEKDFGSFEDFKKEFSTAGATQFGSGWAWLVKDGGKLKVSSLNRYYILLCC